MLLKVYLQQCLLASTSCPIVKKIITRSIECEEHSLKRQNWHLKETQLKEVMLKFSHWELKTTMTDTLTALMGKIYSMQEQIGNAVER